MKSFSLRLPEVGRRGLARLDAREGHPRFYRRQRTTVWADGRPDAPVTAWVYQVVDREAGEVPAAAAYKALIARGARERALPRNYIRCGIAPLPAEYVPTGEPLRLVAD